MSRSPVKYNTDYLKTIIDGISDPVVVFGRDLPVRFMNKAAQIVYGKEGPFGEQISCYQMLHERNSSCGDQEHPCPAQEVFRTGRPVRLLHHHVEENPRPDIVEVTVSPLFNEPGEMPEWFSQKPAPLKPLLWDASPLARVGRAMELIGLRTDGSRSPSNSRSL